MKFQLQVYQDTGTYAVSHVANFSHIRVTVGLHVLGKTVRDEFNSCHITSCAIWLTMLLIRNSEIVIKTVKMLQLKSLSGISSFGQAACAQSGRLLP